MPKVKFYTLGCKVNQYETQEMRECFMRAGILSTGAAQRADIVVINTCTVTHKTDAESLALMRRAHRDHPGACIVVTGCFTERDREAIASCGLADLIVRNKDKTRIIELLRSRKRLCALPEVTPAQGISAFCGHTRAFLKVQDGCDRRCSYCKVWVVRGPSRSRPSGEVKQEARRLVDAGFQEIVLCGICLGAYGREKRPQGSLIALIRELSSIEGLRRIRLSSLEPADLTTEFIREVAQLPVVCRHFHIPLQSGDDRILRAMRRGYLSKDYLRCVQLIRRHIPGCAISTDVLVGFPGEEQAHFAKTITLLERITPMRVHAFAYSRRAGTPAYKMQPVERGQVKQRMARLSVLSRKWALRWAQACLGQIQEVLFEEKAGCSRRAYWQGYTDTYLRVRVGSAGNLANRILPVRLGTVHAERTGVLVEGILEPSCSEVTK